MKLSFRNRRKATESLLGPDEYILLTFNDVDISSKISGKRAEYALHVSHMEIDDAHMPHSDVSSVDGRRVEIGSLLSFAQVSFDLFYSIYGIGWFNVSYYSRGRVSNKLSLCRNLAGI